MKDVIVSSWALAGLILCAPLSGSSVAQEPKVKIPEPGVPQVMTMEGRYVRAAYNNEGYAILGYRLANLTVGEKWMLLEVGLTVRDGVPDFRITRGAFSLETPDGKTIAFAVCRGVPPGGPAGTRQSRRRPCATRSTTSRRLPPRPAGSASSPTWSSRAMTYDEVELSSGAAASAGCTSRCPAGSATASTG